MKKESTASDDLFDLLFVAQDIDGQNVVQMNTELSLCPQAAKAQYIYQTIRPQLSKQSLTLVTVDDGPVQERATLCNYCCELTKGLFGVTKSTKNL